MLPYTMMKEVRRIGTNDRRKKNDRTDDLDRIFSAYRISAAAAGIFFLFSLVLLYRVVVAEAGIVLLAMLLLSGFLWIGATSISRHSYVLVKNRIGQRVGIWEFIATQFVVVLFPFYYRRMKREVDAYRRRRERKRPHATYSE